jgi:hypothetical protein
MNRNVVTAGRNKAKTPDAEGLTSDTGCGANRGNEEASVNTRSPVGTKEIPLGVKPCQVHLKKLLIENLIRKILCFYLKVAGLFLSFPLSSLLCLCLSLSILAVKMR